MMMLTAAQMREADRRCIEELGIPGAVLMNNAGSAVFAHIATGPVGVVCGKGNNGGDGFVVARLARLAGLETRVVLVGSREEVGGDAATFMGVYERLGGMVREARDETDASEAVRALGECAVLVDALLGTGITGPPRGAIRAAIEAWPDARTIAVDLPSGMNTDTGETPGICVRADLTVTFAFAKQGFANPAAAAFLGQVHVADIGIPPVCADDAAWAALRERSPGR